jgi:antitoxin component YwqK of YwqJK toxin-antitoxin module
MFKTAFLFLLGLIVCQSVRAQKTDTLLYFCKNSGELVANLDSADFVIQVSPPDNDDTNLYVVKEYYNNGFKKLLGRSINNNLPLRFQGPLIEYNVHGQKVSIQTLENGVTKGDITTYYPNGKIYATYETMSDGFGVFY